MDWQPALFGFACLGAVALTTKARAITPHLVAWLMVSVWAGANLLWLSDQTDKMALLDFPVAAGAYVIWFEERKTWQRWFASIYAFRLFLHVSYPGSGAVGEVAYLHLLNATFFAALAAISWEGGADVARDCLRSLSRHLRRVSAFASALGSLAK